MPKNSAWSVERDWYAPPTYILHHPLQRQYATFTVQHQGAIKYDPEALQQQILGIVNTAIRKEKK
jgi:hypothetical protein